MSPVPPPRNYNAHNHWHYILCVRYNVSCMCVCVCVQMKTGIGFRPSVPENLSHNSPAPDSVAVYLSFLSLLFFFISTARVRVVPTCTLYYYSVRRRLFDYKFIIYTRLYYIPLNIQYLYGYIHIGR